MFETRKFHSFAKSLASIASDATVMTTAQITCLGKYLTEINVESYLIEREYTDAGYLVDYANYYSRCHHHYPRKTIRLHFFAMNEVELSDQLQGALGGAAETHLQQCYRGFVVVKPLPQTVVGRTCLKTYPPEDNVSGRSRIFPIERQYKVNLHGIDLQVQSIAFQEQDSETAACATAAIWYALHAMPRKIATDEIPSPYDITKIGSSTYIKRDKGDVSRQFPAGGLGLEQIESYLRKFDLECIVCGLRAEVANSRIKEYLDSYLRAGYPMIIVGNMYVRQKTGADYELRGLHAITALGYADSNTFVAGSAAQRMERLFAHDDNVGPFTSFRFDTTPEVMTAASEALKVENFPTAEDIVRRVRRNEHDENSNSSQEFLSNESGLESESRTYRRILPLYLVIPINSKVRVPLEVVTTLATLIFNAFEKIKKATWGVRKTPPTISWSCRLKDVSTVKRELRTQETVERNDDFIELLMKPMPRYLWDVSFAEQNSSDRPTTLIQILVDATDLLQGGGVVGIVVHDVDNPNAEAFNSFLSRSVIDWVARSLSQQGAQVVPILRSLNALFQEARTITLAQVSSQLAATK